MLFPASKASLRVPLALPGGRRLHRRALRVPERHAAGLLLTVAVSAGAWLAWLNPHLAFWDLNDAKNHMHRLYLLTWMIDHGVWNPRWLPDLFMGYGFPVFNYYAPGFYYLGFLLSRLFSLDPWEAFRWAGVVAALLATTGTYWLALELWGRVSTGLLAAVATLYGPYVFQLNLFKKGDVPEALALAMLPWLLLAIRRLWRASAETERAAWLAAATAAGVALILFHNISAVLAAGIATVWVSHHFLVHRSWAALARVVAAGSLAAGLTACFWLPAIGELGAVQLHQLHEGQLHYSQWLVDPSGAAPAHQHPDNRQTRTGLIDLNWRYPHQLVAPPKASLAQAALGLLAAGAMLVQLWQRRTTFLMPLVTATFATWLLTFTFAAPLWEHVPGLRLLQLPYRFLGPAGILVAVGGAGAVAMLMDTGERRWRVWGQRAGWGVALLVGAVVLVNSVGDRPVSTTNDARPSVDGVSLLANEREDRVGLGSTTTREFTPRDVEIGVYSPLQVADRGLW